MVLVNIAGWIAIIIPAKNPPMFPANFLPKKNAGITAKVININGMINCVFNIVTSSSKK